jgi:glycosyltransferase involved in cell wall biosynthesis
MRRIRVLRIITRLNVGGPAIQAVLLSTRLDPARYDCVLASGTESAFEGNMIELGRLAAPPTLRRVPTLGREISPLDDLRALGALVRLMRELKPDIVHTHLAKAGTLGRVAARIVGVPVVIHTYHGTVFRGYFGSLRSRIFLEIERIVARVTTRLIAITAGQRGELIALGIGTDAKVVEIPLGLELASFVDAPSRHEARSMLDLTPDEPVVAIVARLVPIKDVGLFLQAFARVTSAATAIIVGDGPDRAGLEAQAAALGIAGRCRFLGWRRDVNAVYAAADVVTLTSRNEGSPVSIIEAMAAGRAVVCTNVGGVADVVTPGVSGMLVTYGDAEALAASIDELLGDPDLRSRLGAEARRAVYPRYDVSRLVSDISALYTGLVQR